MRFAKPTIHCLALSAIILGLPLTSTKADATEFRTQTNLKAATVFSDRATLTRNVELEIPAGKHVVVFENLPATLFPDSLRIEGEGNAKTILGALSSKIVNSTKLASTREQVLNEEKEKLENQRKVLEAEKQALQAQQSFLTSLKAQASKKTNEDEIAELNLNTEKWVAAANTIYTGISETLKASIQKDIEIKQLNEQIQKINRDLNQLRTDQKRTYEVTLPIELASAGRISLDLSYQLGNVSWRPVYDARLSTEKGELELTQFGSISQRTGEDWTNIELTLSTAQPQRGATIPDMPPMWLSLGYNHNLRKAKSVQSYVASAPNLAAAPRMEAMEMEMAEADAMDTPLDMQTATINNGGFSAEYGIPGLSSIPADGTHTKVLIAPFELETALEIHLKPQITHNAYLIAQSELKGESPILPGQVSLFRDGAYIGQTTIPLLRPGAKHELSFGIDDQISVKHKTLKDEQGEEGILIGKSKTIERHTVTEVQNLHQTEADIVVLQNVPASKNEEISIKINDKKTTSGFEANHDNMKGLTKWSFTLEPKASKNIELGYSVSWPKDQNLTGLR